MGTVTYCDENGNQLTRDMTETEEAQVLVDQQNAVEECIRCLKIDIYNKKEAMYVHGDKILMCNYREKNMLEIDPNCGITITHSNATVLAASQYNKSIMDKYAEVTDNSTVAELEQILTDLQTIEDNKTF